MTYFFHKKMVPECKPEWNREAITVFSRLPSLMAADKPCPQLKPSLILLLTEFENQNVRNLIHNTCFTNLIQVVEFQ